MAFFRIKRINKKDYKYVVETYREGDKVKQRQKYLGKATREDKWVLKNMKSSKVQKQLANSQMDHYKSKFDQEIEIIPPGEVELYQQNLQREKEDKISKAANRVANAIIRLRFALEQFPLNHYSSTDKSYTINLLDGVSNEIKDFLDNG